MKRFLLALALLLVPATASAQCNGNFSASRFCGTGASSGGAPGQQPYSAIFNTLPLANGDIFMGNGSNIATAVAPVSAGDCTWVVNNTGTFTQTCTKTNGIAFAPSATIDTTNASNITGGTLNTLRLPAPFTSGTRQGNTSAFVTYNGSAPITGHIATYDANGNIQDGGGSTGTVTTTGSPANFQTTVFTGATSISGISTGNLGQAFISNGASNYPSYQSGPWTLLATLTASNSATLSDTSHFISAYNDYLLVFSCIMPVTNGVNAELQVHSGGSYQTTAYISLASLGATSQAPTTFIPLALQAGDVPNTAPGISGSLLLTGFNIASTPKNWIGQIGYVTGASYRPISVGGMWNSTPAIDGFQFFLSSGNIASGTIKIYGRL